MASLLWTLWTWTFGTWNSCTRTSWISLTWFSTPLLAAALGVLLPTAAEASILITIDKSSQQMSVAVDGAERYTWPVSTGRPGYDTPSGSFKPNRMDADHYSQEWDNAPMPHAIFFDMEGHAIHGFFDVKHLGSAVSHGCVRLSPQHAAMLFDLVEAEGMGETKVVVAGRTPGGDNVPVARAHLPVNETVSSEPAQASPGYGQQPGYAQQPAYGQTGLRATCLWAARLWTASLRAADLWAADLRAALLCAADLWPVLLCATGLRPADLCAAELWPTGIPAVMKPSSFTPC